MGAADIFEWSSEEAKRIISDNLFFNNGNTSFRIYSGRTVPALEKVLELDPNFEFAKAIYADIQNNFEFSRSEFPCVCKINC